MIKYARLKIAPAVGAGASLGETNLNTFDDDVTRKVTGILSTNQTALVRTVLLQKSKMVADIDGGIMAQQRTFIDIDTTYVGGIPITVDVRNESGAPVGANTMAIVVRYEAP